MAGSTKERILSAALAGFAARGVEATSLDDVAVAVGVTKQTVLYWFGSKQALVDGVIDTAVAQLGDELERAFDERRSGRDAVEAVVDAALRVGARRPDLLVVLREVTRLGPAAVATLVAAVGPRLDAAALVIAGPDAPAAAVRARRRRLVTAGARVVAAAVEAELLRLLDAPPDRAWLRRTRAELLSMLT